VVTDSAGKVGVSFRTLNIANVTPTAVITGATSVAAGGSITLDASASRATGTRTITGYQWGLVSGTNVASLTGSTTASSITLNALSAGTAVVQLTVIDSEGGS